MIVLCRFAVGIGKPACHYVIVPALGGKSGAALLVTPSGIEHRHRSICPNQHTQPLHAGQKPFRRGNRPVAHLLQHDIVPMLPCERRLRPRAQLGFGIKLLSQPRAAARVVDDLRAG